VLVVGNVFEYLAQLLSKVISINRSDRTRQSSSRSLGVIIGVPCHSYVGRNTGIDHFEAIELAGSLEDAPHVTGIAMQVIHTPDDVLKGKTIPCSSGTCASHLPKFFHWRSVKFTNMELFSFSSRRRDSGQ
jgi:hypothetical protein